MKAPKQYRPARLTIQPSETSLATLVRMSEATQEDQGHYRTPAMVATELVELSLRHLEVLNKAEFERGFGKE